MLGVDWCVRGRERERERVVSERVMHVMHVIESVCDVGADHNPRHEYRTYRYQQSRYAEVHVLLLTWAFHDLKGCFDEEMGDFIIGLEEETARLHDTFETYGYHVHDVRISMDSPLDHVSKKLKKFLAHANDETLLIIYYHGHGGLNESSELVFNSHQHPDDLKQAQAAAAELYAAMAKGDLCPKHDRPNRYQQLLRK